jgi:hypothetical protein
MTDLAVAFWVARVDMLGGYDEDIWGLEGVVRCWGCVVLYVKEDGRLRIYLRRSSM